MTVFLRWWTVGRSYGEQGMCFRVVSQRCVCASFLLVPVPVYGLFFSQDGGFLGRMAVAEMVSVRVRGDRPCDGGGIPIIYKE